MKFRVFAVRGDAFRFVSSPGCGGEAATAFSGRRNEVDIIVIELTVKIKAFSISKIKTKIRE